MALVKKIRFFKETPSSTITEGQLVDLNKLCSIVLKKRIFSERYELHNGLK